MEVKEFNKILILDYGSQVTQLIARRIREAGVYSEILPWNAAFAKIKQANPKAIILSGGPARVQDTGAPDLNPEIFSLQIPILGICYGMHLLAKNLGGQIAESQSREYGASNFTLLNRDSLLWQGLEGDSERVVWMSHGDIVSELPPDFEVLGKTATLDIAAFANQKRQIYGLQFHPEMQHTKDGPQILQNFLFKIAKVEANWQMPAFIEHTIKRLKAEIGDSQVVCALSGGIDSTVTAMLLQKAIGKNLHSIFVDTGLLRVNEAEEVLDYLRNNCQLDLVLANAQERFLKELKGVTDPEVKRKAIGHTFIAVFEEEAAKLPKVEFLAQGTLYPDVIESVSVCGASSVIKSHHNVGGLPERMKLKLVEPLRDLFKDEVRALARELGLPDKVIKRHPFPGPGLAIRICGEVTESRLDVLRQADSIVREELEKSGWYDKVWQGFAVLLPLHTVGVMGDARTYGEIIALRIVDSLDAMTANWTQISHKVLENISGRITNEVAGVNRVVYDITSKPPATIEWE